MVHPLPSVVALHPRKIQTNRVEIRMQDTLVTMCAKFQTPTDSYKIRTFLATRILADQGAEVINQALLISSIRDALTGENRLTSRTNPVISPPAKVP